MSTPVPSREREPTAAEPMLGRILDGRYRLEQRLGEGGLGTVYRAQHLKLARAVAVKVLREDLRAIPQIRARFEREVRALSSLSHPNVVTITDYGIADGSPYLVMELVEGTELARMVGAPMPAPRALAIVRQILASLAYAHERDVVHRDLKPANVIVRTLPDGRDHVVVLDFGLAKFVGDADANGTDLTRSGLVVGTPAYMPPEQMAAGARRTDARSDLYAVGLILFELVAGRRPFLAEDPADLLRAHLVAEPPTLSEALGGTPVHPALEAIVERALAKAPEARYASARAMIDALDALPSEPLVGADAARTAVLAPRRARVRDRHERNRWVAATAAIVGGVAAIAWVATHPASPDAPTSRPDARARSTPEPTQGTESTGEASTPPVPSAPAPADDVAARETVAVERLPGTADRDDLAAASHDLAAASHGPGAESAARAEHADQDPSVPPATATARPPARDILRGRLPGLLGRARARIERGRTLSDGELRALTRHRNDHPLDPRVRLLLGHAYVQRGWLSAALEQYERAFAIDPSARGNERMLEDLLHIARTETLAARGGEAVERIYGAEAVEPLRRAIGRERRADERARLEALLARITR